MENKLKVKSVNGATVEIPFDPSQPIVLEVISADTESTVIVKDPTGATSTEYWVGGMKKH